MKLLSYFQGINKSEQVYLTFINDEVKDIDGEFSKCMHMEHLHLRNKLKN